MRLAVNNDIQSRRGERHLLNCFVLNTNVCYKLKTLNITINIFIKSLFISFVIFQ